MSSEPSDETITGVLIRVVGSAIEGPAGIVLQVSKAAQRVIEAVAGLVNKGLADDLKAIRQQDERRREAATVRAEAAARIRMSEAAAAAELESISKARRRILEAKAVSAEAGARAASAASDALTAGLDTAAIELQIEKIESQIKFLRAARGTEIVVDTNELLAARASWQAVTPRSARLTEEVITARRRIFGTDGVRGTAGQPPLDSHTIARIGKAIARTLARRGTGRVLVGRDTRESGEWIEQMLARGITSEGARLVSAGVMPTPAIAYLTRASGTFAAGIMITASHNPFHDNGIRVISGLGDRFADEIEAEIETMIADPAFIADTEGSADVIREDFAESYLSHALTVLPDPSALRGTRIALDCANGAMSTVAPRLFRRLGFDVTVIGGEPDGRNINLNCGSTRPEALAALVREQGLRLGVAFDGDGDRAILVDRDGKLVDGDAVMLMCAAHMQARGRLRGNAIVATVMSNIGLEIGLRKHGIELLRAPIGDKYAREAVLERNLSLGGEQSGHVIFSDYLFTGDGIATALSVLRTMVESGKELGELASQLETYPQVLVNVRVREKKELKTLPEVASVIADVESRLDGNGRLLIRYSGTEPLVRIMIEGRNQQDIQNWADQIADVVRAHLAP